METRLIIAYTLIAFLFVALAVCAVVVSRKRNAQREKMAGRGYGKRYPISIRKSVRTIQ